MTTHSELLALDRFPLSSKYDGDWIIENEMGPNVLWLTEFLCETMDLRPGMRVLDLGCGKAVSSIFLAREFDVQVWATDLWISPTENLQRIREADLEDRAFPIHADARELPFADAFFDAIVSVDAFEYFGTDELYLQSLVRLLKLGHQLGIVNAGVHQEVESLPDEWPSDFCKFHTPEWWRRHWSMTRCVHVEAAENMPDGRELWLRWHKVLGVIDDEWLRLPVGENLGFHRVVARRTS
ncbi:MAG: methyltransferase domain-containing protein [Actinomycetota bacterium]|nr:methyltransferase domain-containing protein [Actinomycetota bacterium]